MLCLIFLGIYFTESVCVCVVCAYIFCHFWRKRYVYY